jgi:two-component system, chemotaxis family, protein-glutamate methylesterase/glutaminase
VVLASSTGGPNALADLATSIPADFPAPILVAQHMPPVFTRMLADRLQSHCRIPVREAGGGEVLSGGAIFIAPGDHHLAVVREGGVLHLRLSQQPPENSCRPAADVLFRSAAAAVGAGVLAVVMTGMGQDGMRGAAIIRTADGVVLAQDEASSVVWGMPGAVVHAGLADEILPLDRLGPSIVRRTGAGVLRGLNHG